MKKILVSACLLGEAVRYNGGAATSLHPILVRWFEEGRLVSFCPEVAGGLSTPRPPAEIQGPASGDRVLEGEARVTTVHGADVTAAFLRGAFGALEAARRNGCPIAILKEGSPSCGSREIHDGTFSGTRVKGFGVTCAQLTAAGIKVFNEAEIDEAAAWLAGLE